MSLNGGEIIDFTDADTDLMVTGPDGERVFVDMSSISSGFNGDVDITADGTLSTDSGATEIPIDFSANQVVTDSRTGEVTHVDSTSIRRAGTEHLEYAGTADVFETLIELRDELRNVRGLSEDEFHEAMSRRIADLDRVRDGLLQTVGEQSTTLDNLDGLQRRAENFQLETQEAISNLESADFSEIIVKLQEEQTLLQLNLASSVRLFDQNLLDFLG